MRVQNIDNNRDTGNRINLPKEAPPVGGLPSQQAGTLPERDGSQLIPRNVQKPKYSEQSDFCIIRQRHLNYYVSLKRTMNRLIKLKYSSLNIIIAF